MDYEKKYKEALERMKYVVIEPKNERQLQLIKETVFPELSESEDENIRGAIIDHLKDYNLTEWAAWLEKQGQTFTNQARKLEMEKAAFSTKDKQKFKVGDWIIKNDDSHINIDYICCEITKIENGNYTVESIYGYKGYNTFETFEKDYHLWTIQDAKDGDVICYKDEISLYKHDIKNCTKQEITFGGFVYHCCYDGKRFITDSLYSLTEQDKIDVHPATKEQRDLLFSKMKKAGYEWDAEKKELKEIDSYCQEHCKGYQETGRCFADGECEAKKNAKTGWSKEDKDYYDAIIAKLEVTQDDAALTDNQMEFLKSLKDRVQPKQEWSEEDEEMLDGIILRCEKYGYQEQIDWLKSLKQRIEG